MTAFGPWRRLDLWLTPDQQADRLFRERKYHEAAEAYTDPFRQGTAHYRAGDFKAAAESFARDGSPEGTYGRGNALILLGKYDDAIKSYDRALSLRPGWKDAEDNRAVAVVRRDRMKFQGGDATGGEEKPDAIVFEKGKNKAGDTVQVDGGEPLSDDQLRSLWLRRVQTKPADFLRAKFAFQLQERAGGAKVRCLRLMLAPAVVLAGTAGSSPEPQLCPRRLCKCVDRGGQGDHLGRPSGSRSSSCSGPRGTSPAPRPSTCPACRA